MAMSVTYVIWMIGIHSIIHGIFGLVFVLTSDYVNKSPELNYGLAALYGIMIFLGVMVFCVIVCKLPLCAILFGVLFGLLALAIIIVSIIYTIKYWPFFANCILDRLFFYTDCDCWVGPEFKMTIWHFFTIFFIVMALLWFLYACLLCKYARCVCCLPCPPRACYKPPPCTVPCCIKDTWYKRLIRSKCPAYPPPPPCPSTKTPMCVPCPTPRCPTVGSLPACPKPCTPPPPPPPPCPCPPPPCPAKKTPKFVLTLRPGKTVCK